MEKLPVTHVTPSYSHSSRASSRVYDQAFLYDDYAREVPHVNAIAARYSIINHENTNLCLRKRHSPLYIVTLLALVVFVVQFGGNIADVPSTRLLEGLICNEYHRISSGNLLPETHCGVDAVQGELNVITTVALILGYLPGIIVAFPCGLLADKYGRKSILGLCVLGMVLCQLIWIVFAWNWRLWGLRLVWTSSAALLLGGGQSIAEAMVFAMVSDVASEDKKAVYFQVQICAVLLAETMAPIVASKMMDYSVWLPIIVSPIIMTIGGLLVIAIPETLELRSLLAHSMSPYPSISSNFTKRARRHAQNFDPSTPWSRFHDRIHTICRILKTRDIKLLIPTASISIPVATITMSIILRYIPLRFDWTLAQTGVILGMRTGFNILVLLLILPLMGYIFSKRNATSRDLILARLSTALLVLGQAVFAAAPNVAVAHTGLAILTLGTGAPCLCRSILTRFVDSESIACLFSILAVCEMVGYLACGVGFGALYQVGMQLGLDSEGVLRTDGNGEWLALVFFVAAVVYFWCACMLWVIDGSEAKDMLDEESICSEKSKDSVNIERELRVLADGRMARKCPSLESVAVKV